MEGIIKRYRSVIGPRDFYKRAMRIAIPVMLQSLIQNLVSLIDNFMVAGLGDVKMSGVNIAGQMLFVSMVFTNAICMAGGIFMTQFYGADDKKGMQQTFRFKLAILGIMAVLYMLACFVFNRPILKLMVIGNSQADKILEQGSSYMFLMGFIGIPMIISVAIASSLREIGQVKAPLLISVCATIVNTFFNWLFIYGNLGAPRLEVRGAAYATIIARCVEMIIYLIYVRKIKPPFLIKITELFRVDTKLFGSILKKGWMVVASEMLWVISETITTALYNGKGGADVVSGMASSFAIANLYFVAFGGISTAASVLIGKSLGEGKLDKARQEKTWLYSAAIIFGVIMTFVGLLTVLLVPVVFGNLSLNAQKICKEMVFGMALFMPAWVFINTEFAISRAGGDTMMGIILDGIGTVAIVIPGTFILALCTSVGPVAMYMLMKLVDFPKIVVAYFWLKKEKWVRNLAVENASR